MGKVRLYAELLFGLKLINPFSARRLSLFSTIVLLFRCAGGFSTWWVWGWGWGWAGFLICTGCVITTDSALEEWGKSCLFLTHTVRGPTQRTQRLGL